MCNETAMMITSHFKGTKHDEPRIRSGFSPPRELVLIVNVYTSLPLYRLSTTRLGAFHRCDSSELSPFQLSHWLNSGLLIGPVFSSVRFTDISTADQAEGRELSRDRKQRRHSYMNGPYYSYI